MSDIANVLWAQFTQETAASLGAGQTDAAIQVLTTSVRVPVVDDAKAVQTELEVFLAMVPAWGSAYVASAEHVLEAYGIVLNQIQPTPTASSSVQQAYEKQSKIMLKAAEAVTKFKTSHLMDWVKEKKQLSDAGVPDDQIPTWDEYWQPYEAAFQVLTAKSKKEADIGKAIVAAQAPSGFIQALDAYNAQAKSKAPAPPYTIVPAPYTTFEQWLNNPGESSKSISIVQGSASYDYSKSVWKKQSSESVFFGLFHKSESSGATREELVTSNSYYKITVAYQSQATFVASHTNWINTALLKNYEKGPWVSGSQFDAGKAQPWGEKGIFSLMPTQLYVVLNPTITIELDDNTYNNVKSTMDNSSDGGWSVGPFYRDASSQSASNVSQKIQWDDKANSVQITDTSNVPQIVAVSSDVMP